MEDQGSWLQEPGCRNSIVIYPWHSLSCQHSISSLSWLHLYGYLLWQQDDDRDTSLMVAQVQISMFNSRGKISWPILAADCIHSWNILYVKGNKVPWYDHIPSTFWRMDWIHPIQIHRREEGRAGFPEGKWCANTKTKGTAGWGTREHLPIALFQALTVWEAGILSWWVSNNLSVKASQLHLLFL